MAFGPPSHVRACISGVDMSRVEKRPWCRLSRTAFSFVKAIPRMLNDVTL